MLWFKFHNDRSGSDVYVNLANYDAAKTINGDVELFSNQHVSSGNYTVTGEDAKRLVRIMDREADKATPVNFGEPA